MVEIYDDKVSIVSPGSVPKGITKENFGKISVARNPIIADLLRRTHYIERIGTGIGRMRELMKSAGLKEPEFDYDNYFFDANFQRPSYYDENYGTYDLSKNNKNKLKQNLNKTQVKILELIRKNPEITQKEMAEEVGISDSAIQKSVFALRHKKIISRQGNKRTGKWIINEQIKKNIYAKSI